MAKQRKLVKAPQKPAEKQGDLRLAYVERELTKMGQDFSQAAKKFAESNGVSVDVHITMIPQLKETIDGSK